MQLFVTFHTIHVVSRNFRRKIHLRDLLGCGKTFTWWSRCEGVTFQVESDDVLAELLLHVANGCRHCFRSRPMMVEKCVRPVAEKYVTLLIRAQGLVRAMCRLSLRGRVQRSRVMCFDLCHKNVCGPDVLLGCLQRWNGLSVFHRCFRERSRT